jgi:formyl-CoA transferase
MASASPPVVGPPLEGLTVVAVEQSVAAPLCSRILADMGARVIKVERPPAGDFARHWDDHVHGESGQYWWLNRGKESIALDLQSAEDHALLDQLLASADVLVHNMSPGAAERVGIGRAACERFPALVNCQISGYGDHGAFRDRKAYDMLVQAESGIMSLTGTRELPTRVGVSICDVATGIYAAAVVLAGVQRLRETGTGAFLDLAMFDVALEFVGPMLMSFMNSQVSYPRLAQHHHAIAPYGVFNCADDSPLLIAVEQDTEWLVFCERVLEAPELSADTRFATNLDRVRHRDELVALVAERFGRLGAQEAADRLDAAGIAYAFVREVHDLPDHPVAVERGLFARERTRSGFEVASVIGLAARAYGYPGRGRDRPPGLDEDGEAIRSSRPRGGS